MNIKERVEEICQERNIKKSELADMAGISRSTLYSMLERGRGANIINIKKLCDATGMTIDDFIEETRDERINRLTKVISNMDSEDKEYLIAMMEGATKAVHEKRKKYTVK